MHEHSSTDISPVTISESIYIPNNPQVERNLVIICTLAPTFVFVVSGRTRVDDSRVINNI